MASSVELFRLGACLPDDSAPPLAAKLWHCAQFSRNSSPPSPRLLRSPRRSPVGTTGPPPTDCTYAAIWLTSSSVYGGPTGGGCSVAVSPDCSSRVGLRGSWAPCPLAGIRPVATWKDTAAWPTPSRLGPRPCTPCRLAAWQAMQALRYSCSPCATSLGDASADGSLAVLLGANAA